MKQMAVAVTGMLWAGSNSEANRHERSLFCIPWSQGAVRKDEITVSPCAWAVPGAHGYEHAQGTTLSITGTNGSVSTCKHKQQSIAWRCSLRAILLPKCVNFGRGTGCAPTLPPSAVQHTHMEWKQQWDKNVTFTYHSSGSQRLFITDHNSVHCW